MKNRTPAWIAGLLLLFLSSGAWAMPEPPDVPEVPETAYGEDAFDAGEPRTAKRLILDSEEVRPGDRIRAGVIFEMDPGWHIYWRYPGGGGMSTEISVESAAGEGQVQWPEPTVYFEAGGRIITFGYGGRALLFSEVEIPEDAEGEVEIRAEVDYLVCEVDCIPGKASLSRTVRVGEEQQAATDGSVAWFEHSQIQVPRSPEETGIDVEVRYSHVPIKAGESFRVEVSAIGCVEAGEPGCVELGAPPERPAEAIVYEGVDAIVFEVARVSPHPEAHSGWFIELNGRATQDVRTQDGRFVTVVKARGADGEVLGTEVDVLFPRSDSEEAQELSLGGAAEDAAGPSPREDEEPLSLWFVLMLAFLGGALLNLMPCVFPVLAVKVFSFVQLVQEKRQSVLAHSMFYTAGIVGSLMALATVVIGLQVFGTHVGWGFQFQEPRFIALVSAVVVIFALNLFGVFQVSLSPGKLQGVAQAPPSHRRSFGEGVLAVVLATPCSAPFLGTAVGFALASSPWMIALIFFVLGLGLAAPFVILTMVPGAAKVLPKPGAWMGVFKQFLGFALIGTAVWLVWLIGQMTGVGGVTRLLIFLMGCALGVWIFGLVQYRSKQAKWIGGVLALALVASTGFMTLQFEDAGSGGIEQDREPSGPIAWIAWSEEAVQEELEAGRPVFVDFTADWCITCKVNEANVLEHRSVLAAIDEFDVAMVMADWTRRDERIRLKLSEFGKAGVPMYLMYAPEDPSNPRVLPELLTRERVISEMREASQITQ